MSAYFNNPAQSQCACQKKCLFFFYWEQTRTCIRRHSIKLQLFFLSTRVTSWWSSGLKWGERKFKMFHYFIVTSCSIHSLHIFFRYAMYTLTSHNIGYDCTNVIRSNTTPDVFIDTVTKYAIYIVKWIVLNENWKKQHVFVTYCSVIKMCKNSILIFFFFTNVRNKKNKKTPGGKKFANFWFYTLGLFRKGNLLTFMPTFLNLCGKLSSCQSELKRCIVFEHRKRQRCLKWTWSYFEASLWGASQLHVWLVVGNIADIKDRG